MASADLIIDLTSKRPDENCGSLNGPSNGIYLLSLRWLVFGILKGADKAPVPKAEPFSAARNRVNPRLAGLFQ